MVEANMHRYDMELAAARERTDKISAMVKIWRDGDEPEGQISARMVLDNIAQLLGVGPAIGVLNCGGVLILGTACRQCKRCKEVYGG